MSHDHSHAPKSERALWIALGLNAGFLVVEATVGWWTNSLALLSDAGHMVSDVGALMVALFAVRLGARAASDQYTFGWRRAPVLGALLNALSLLVIVVLIVVEAVERFSDPPPVDAFAVFWTGLAGLAVNLLSAWYIARTEDTSVNMRGAMLHLLSDALGSVAAVVAAISVWIWHFELADPLASLAIGLLIFAGTIPLIRDTLRILLQSAPASVDLAAIRKALCEAPHVDEALDLHVWEIDSGEFILTAILISTVETLAEVDGVIDEARALLRARFGIDHATLECRHGASSGMPLAY